MEISYSNFDLLLYLLLYSFLGWGIEVCCNAVRDRRFVNHGFLNLPFTIPHGVTAVILLLVLPTMEHNIVLQYIMTFIVFCSVWSISHQFVRSISRKKAMPGAKGDTISRRRGILTAMLIALVYLVLYLIVHPLIFGVLSLLPQWIVRVVVIAAGVLVAVDFASVLYTLRTNTPLKGSEERKAETQRLADRMTASIWQRLQKAYPGIEQSDDPAEDYVFAKGICFDKLVWVFLVSSFLGALIEMGYCRAMGGIWMSRSSVLYGTFSFVWGFGAVVLTVVLRRLAGKEDRKVFLAGFVVGGAYEYFCSVFTELVFGTVFWDYSEMPLNIGGRTNVLYCIFWGLLAVVWIKVLYPPMERSIEKLPPLLGKVLTWVVVFLMVCNGLLTSAAMIRYTERQTQTEPTGVIEQFLDSRYDDQWMERRWPNMVVTDKG